MELYNVGGCSWRWLADAAVVGEYFFCWELLRVPHINSIINALMVSHSLYVFVYVDFSNDNGRGLRIAR